MTEIPTYTWVARFKDGRILRQIENDKIFHFKEDVLSHSDELIEFWLEGKGKIYGINLLTGDFHINGTKFSDLNIKLATHIDVEYPINVPLRPIFFRRTSRMFNALTKEEISVYFVYAIGWQATVEIPVLNIGDTHWHPEKRNVKHILYIHEQTGELVFG